MRKAIFTLGLACGFIASALASDKPIYLMVAPNDLYDLLSWYIGERAKNHPEVEFAIVNTKTEIYDVAAYDYRQKGTSKCRNAAESIHKYLRQYYKSHPNLKYVVLGGVWYDTVNFRGMNPVYFRNDDTEVTLDNAIPGIFCPFLSTFGGNYATDMFYGCLKEKGAYPWDANGNGQYMDEEECREKQVDVVPSVAVARLSFIPRPEIKDANGRMLNQHEMITNYLHKLQRAEADDFSGRSKYGAEGSWVNGSQPNNSGDMDRQEFEFYDFAPNMGDPRSAKTHGDEEALSRRDLKNIAAKHPILQCKTLNDSAKTARGLEYSSISDDFFNSDMDYAWVYSHGWAMGGSYFSASAYTSHKGLLKFLNGCVPCDTGMIDYYEKTNGKTYLHWCLGSSGLMSPNAGFLASINNTRYGVDGDSASNGLKTAVDRHFAHNHETAGEAWMNAILDQHNKHFAHASWMVQRNYAVAIFHGDPLVKILDEEDVTITDETWSALQVVKDATISTARLSVPQTVAMMSATLTANSDFTLNSEHEFRVMNTLTAPAGYALTLNAPGGVGKGIEFAEANEKNILTINSPAYFYLGGLKNAKELALTGEGAVIEADNLQEVESLSFNGSNHSGSPNILRSRTKGALKNYPSFALKSTALELQTWEPFEGVAESPNITLDDADLIVGQNPFWGLTGYGQTLSGAMTIANGSKLKVKCTKEVVLDSLNIASIGKGNGFETIDGGVFGLKGTTTITLEPGTTFAMVAEFKDLGSGKLVFRSPNATAENPARVDFTQAKLAGAIELGENVILSDPSIVTWNENNTALKAKDFPAGTKFFFPNMIESPWVVDVVGDVKMGPSFFANSETQYIFVDFTFLEEETASITTDSLAIIGDTQFWIPLTLNKLVISGEFGCTETLTCPDVVVENGGTLRLEGTPNAQIVLRDGAILKAVPDYEDGVDSLILNTPAAITWEGEVLIDVAEIKERLADEPVSIIGGDAHIWTAAELANFKVLDEDVVLRIGEDGSLQLAAPTKLKKGPYTRTISDSSTVWDSADWDGFTEKWSAYELDMTAMAKVKIDHDTILAIDTDVALKSVAFTGEGKVVIKGEEFGTLEVVDIDFTALIGDIAIEDLEVVGTIHASPKMTMTAVNGAKVLMHAGDELTIEDPRNCSLTFDALSQGIVYLRSTTLKANKNELFHMDDAPMSGFEFVAVNESGAVDTAVEIYYDETSRMICSRPLGGLSATITGGTASFAALNWKNIANESVTISDWSSVEEVGLKVSGNATIALNAAPKLKLTIEGSGTLTIKEVADSNFVLPSTLVVNGVKLVVVGDILPRLDAVSGTGSITLDTGARTEYPLAEVTSPAKNITQGITINDGSEFAVVFSRNLNFWNASNWSGLKGEGKLVFASDNGTKYRIFPPNNTWSQTLSFAAYVELLYPFHGSGSSYEAPTYTYRFKNLEGTAQIGVEPGDNASWAKVVYEITQTKTTEWSGIGEYLRFSSTGMGTFHEYLLKGNSSVDARLIYTGQCPIGQPIFSGTTPWPEWAASWNHTFTVDRTGVLELDGRWTGTLVNEGFVILGSNAELTMANGTASPLSGRVAGRVDLTENAKVKFDSTMRYDVGVAGEIRFPVNDLHAPKSFICPVTGTLKRGAVKLVAVDPDGNTAARMVMAADISDSYLNWRGPAKKAKMLFR